MACVFVSGVPSHEHDAFPFGFPSNPSLKQLGKGKWGELGRRLKEKIWVKRMEKESTDGKRGIFTRGAQFQRTALAPKPLLVGGLWDFGHGKKQLLEGMDERTIFLLLHPPAPREKVLLMLTPDSSNPVYSYGGVPLQK